MTELHCVNTHTAQADRAVAAAPPPAQQSSSTILAPHSHPLCALSFTTLQCQGTASCRPDPSLSFTACSEPAPESRKNALTGPWRQQSSRIPALQVRVENVMWCFLLHKHTSWQLFWGWAKEQSGDKDCNCLFPKYSTAFDIQGFHLVQLMLGILKPYWNIYIISTSAATLQSNHLLYSFYISQPSQYVPNAEFLKNTGLVNKGYCLLIKEIVLQKLNRLCVECLKKKTNKTIPTFPNTNWTNWQKASYSYTSLLYHYKNTYKERFSPLQDTV